ncbi:MAG: CinA family protein [Ruminococcus sp.]
MDIRVITEDEFLKTLENENIHIDELSSMLVNKLREAEKKVATAESCTGGLISKRITDVSGASAVFDCGVCSYANAIKEKVLGVKRESLKLWGAVSPQVALEMAQGVRALSSADIGISTTGIAGPGGGTEEKPVGLIYIGIAKEGSSTVIKADFTAKKGSRDNKRHLATALALYCGFLVI